MDFDRERGITDNTCAPDCLINKFLDKKINTLCCFVNLSKQFDFPMRENIWYEIIKAGIIGEISAIIRPMYD